MTNPDPRTCDHGIEEIERIDGDGMIRVGSDLYLWGECECGSPTIVSATVTKVEIDSVGSIEDLKRYAGKER